MNEEKDEEMGMGLALLIFIAVTLTALVVPAAWVFLMVRAVRMAWYG